MRALVTGADGFIGSHLVDRLLQDGHDVRCLVKPGEPERNLGGQQNKILCDIMNPDGLRLATRDCDIVYHLAARTDLDGKTVDDYAVNTKGTQNVLRAAEDGGCGKFVFVSSMLAVAVTGKTQAIDESFVEENTTAYGRSKRVAENLVTESPMPWVIIRPTLVFGPRERSTMMGFFKAIKSRRFLLIGSRNVVQSFVYVRNLVDAIYEASLSASAVNHTFFINDSRPYTLEEFASAAATALNTRVRDYKLPLAVATLVGRACYLLETLSGKPMPLPSRRVRTLTTNYVYSIARAQATFDYKPRHDLSSSVRETAEWYEEHALL